MASVTATNLASLAAYPLTPGSYSVDNDNIQKLRTFRVSDVRRWWTVVNQELNDSTFTERSYTNRRWYSSVTIS